MKLWHKSISLVFAVSLCACAPIGPLPDIQGPITKDANKFAIGYFNALQPFSFETGREYCGYFYRDWNGTVQATPVYVGQKVSCDLPPAPSNVIASFHTHGSYAANIDSEVPSVTDLEMDIDEGIDGYVATPEGRVWLNIVKIRRATLICGPDCIRSDPNLKPSNFPTPEASYTLPQLKTRQSQ